MTKKILSGKVIKDKTNKTVVVLVKRKYVHPFFQKVMTSSKKYHVLESIEDSPQLPYGYPTSILISFFPPLWFKIMNPLVEHHMGYSD